MPLHLYNTLTRRKEKFHKSPGELVTMYVCGPTVYKPSHIGHMVGPIIFDTVKRYLVRMMEERAAQKAAAAAQTVDGEKG